ncbi:protein kinase domain-containing protein [Nocardia coubleae]|uniref:Protein kinase n=1 Tax=Nocardia coubleae TaxID=356147 RepID=A0A846WDA9_9NOCA|nr:protein kinase [Nocardia coubleae]NKX91519.1 protein kinase [Nocardia coubleae]
MTIHPPGPDDPQTIGRYRVIGALDPSAGDHSVLATGPDDSLVVVRQVHPELLAEPEFRVRLRHSAVAAMRVAGPSNTTVIDVDADADKPWLASLFVPGVRLDAAVAEHGPLPVPAVRALAAALASALGAVHAAGLVHQRLRADTVLLAKDGGRLGEIGVTPAAGLSTTGTATTIGTPDFLAPEQALGLELTPAVDVFALGSVLAYAASGVAPFAAPSVPYTLFNIANREPDLSRVPEPLYEMLAACLRKDPAARPTPAQILQYLGGPPSGPPPWPAPVLDDIGRVQAEISALRAAAPALTPAEPLPSAKPFAEAVGAKFARLRQTARETAEYGRERWAGADVLARSGIAGGLVVTLLALVGLTYFVSRPEREPGPVTGLTLAELRRIDACAWLTSAIGTGVPVVPTPLPADSWKPRPTGRWGCSLDSGKYILNLELGKEDEYLTLNQTVVDGVPITHGSPSGCVRAIASPGDEREAGIVLTLLTPPSVKDCAGVDHVAAALARSLTAAPQAEHPSPLALIEPCTLFDRDAVTEGIGPLPPQPTIADAHTCQWDALVRLNLQLLRTSNVTTGKNPQVLRVDGMEVYQGDDSTLKCTRAYLVPNAGEETVQVTVEGMPGATQQSCSIATTFLRRAVEKLPKR